MATERRLHVLRYCHDQIFFLCTSLSWIEITCFVSGSNIAGTSSQDAIRTIGTDKTTDATPDFKCENSSIPVTKEFDMLGITIDNKLKFDNHVAKICRKVSQQIAVLKRMKKMLPFETRRDLYLAFILPHFNYCSET